MAALWQGAPDFCRWLKANRQERSPESHPGLGRTTFDF